MGSSSALNHMPIFWQQLRITVYRVKNCTINGTLWNSSTYNVPRPERKRFGTVRKMPKNEPTRKAIIQRRSTKRSSPENHSRSNQDRWCCRTGLVVKKIPQFQSIDINLLQKEGSSVNCYPRRLLPSVLRFSGPMGNDHRAYSLSVLRNNREGWNFRPGSCN